MNTTNKNIKTTTKLIETLNQAIPATQAWDKKAGLLAARDYCLAAVRELHKGNNDAAGRYLEAAHRCIKEVCA